MTLRLAPLYWVSMASSAVAASFISQSNDFILVQTLHARPSDIGIANAIESFGFLVLSIPLGHLLARFRASKISAFCALINASLVAVLLFSYLSGNLSVNLIWSITAINGVVAVASGIAGSSQVGRLFADHQIVKVSARRGVVSQTVSVVVPLLSGFALQAGATPLLLMGAIMCALSASFASHLLSIYEPFQTRFPGEGAPAESRDGPLRRIPLILISLLLIVCNASLAFASSVEVLYQRNDLGMDFGLIGTGVAIGAVGGVLGAVAAEPIMARFPHHAIQIASAAALVVAVCLFYSASQVRPPQAVVLVYVFSFTYAAAMSTFNISLFSYVSLGFPPHQLPRVFGVLQTAGMGCVPLGSLLGGLSGNLLGSSATILIWVGGVVHLLLLSILAAPALSAYAASVANPKAETSRLSGPSGRPPGCSR
ncbi:MFS transporter [Arthrobacter woluwensis]|uniref:Major Facilitator Superfamily protein n=1 Tax=Arthrobacter woluwensis TaxID=156980 RepID=A0A1H4KU75_9MICC|nr:MFS transporter [Arthrobacter woluwensis]SEB61675.1 Major Facilitator Superfamily protein [Arthrobacter woluwensis]